MIQIQPDETPEHDALVAVETARNALAIIDLRTLRSQPDKRNAIKAARELLTEARNTLDWVTAQ